MEYNPRMNKNYQSTQYNPIYHQQQGYQQFNNKYQTLMYQNNQQPHYNQKQDYNQSINSITNKINSLNIAPQQQKEIQPQVQVQSKIIPKIPSTFKPIDIKMVHSIKDENLKREFIGEVLFSNINEHPIVTKENISFDEIGKITGMILGIEDINEVLIPCYDYNELTARIIEAIKLLR